MATLHIVAFAFIAVRLLGEGFCVSDEEFQIHQSLVAAVIREMKSEIQDMSKMLKTQEQEISRQATVISRLETEQKCKPEVLETDNLQNTTIEERVSLLELQVVDLDEDVDFLFGEQLIQDERLLTLEQTTDAINAELVTVDDELEDLETTTLALDFRVTALEENGGGDGNSSVAELELRVETLEGTSADHETRLTTTEEDIEALETTISDQEVRLSAAEENIQGLQTTDVNHDARISALEENGGGGESQNDTIAFHSVLTSYSSIPSGSNVIFNEIILNKGEGYDSSNGVFTVPSGGDGVYYLSMFLLGSHSENGFFDMLLNGDVICSTLPDQGNNGDGDYPSASCSAIVDVIAGDQVEAVFSGGFDDTPLYATTTDLFNGFNGFRI